MVNVSTNRWIRSNDNDHILCGSNEAGLSTFNTGECYNVKRTEMSCLEVIMRLPGGWELILILAIVILLFGPGRISNIAGEIGRSIREFRSGIQEMEEEDSSQLEETKQDDDQG